MLFGYVMYGVTLNPAEGHTRRIVRLTVRMVSNSKRNLGWLGWLIIHKAHLVEPSRVTQVHYIEGVVKVVACNLLTSLQLHTTRATCGLCVGGRTVDKRATFAMCVSCVLLESFCNVVIEHVSKFDIPWYVCRIRVIVHCASACCANMCPYVLPTSTVLWS